MAFKFVALFALLAVARAGNLVSPLAYHHAAPALAVASPAIAHTYAAPFSYEGSSIGSTQQNVVRSFAGTVSQYSKAVDTPFSSVRKVDTRINNNVYTPAYATKTLAYAAPAPLAYAHAPVAATYAAPAYAHAPVAATYAAPASVAYAHAPAPLAYAHAPVAATYAAPAQAVYAQHAAPLAVASHASPITSAYSTKAISYSPASAVAHVTFDGFGAHYGY